MNTRWVPDVHIQEMNRSDSLSTLKSTVLALFLLSGLYKANLRWLPIDLTVLLSIGLVPLILHSFVSQGFKIPRGFLVNGLLFLLLALASLREGLSPYALDKVKGLLTFTAMAALASPILVSSREHLKLFAQALFAVGFVMAAVASATFMMSSSTIERLSVFGSNTIALGRAAGIALIYATLSLSSGEGHVVVSLISICLSVFALLASGSRGPLIAVVLSLLTVFWAFPRSLSRRPGRMVLVLVVVITALFGGLQFGPQASLIRIESFLYGSIGPSTMVRWEAAASSIALISTHPLGIGIGGFEREAAIISGNSLIVYPHNILLEVLLEAGWVAGIYFILTIGWALLRMLQSRHGQDSQLELKFLFCLSLFALSNGLVSGDLNDNRLLFGLIGIGLSLRSEIKGAGIYGQRDTPAS